MLRVNTNCNIEPIPDVAPCLHNMQLINKTNAMNLASMVHVQRNSNTIVSAILYSNESAVRNSVLQAHVLWYFWRVYRWLYSVCAPMVVEVIKAVMAGHDVSNGKLAYCRCGMFH